MIQVNSTSEADIIKAIKDNKMPSPVKAVLLYNPGGRKEVRFGISTSGRLIVMNKRSRRFGGFPPANFFENVVQINLSSKKIISGVERYVDDLRKRKRYLDKHCHPNLWKNLRDEAELITEENLKKLLSDKTTVSRFDAWEVAPKYNLPRIESHKAISLKTALGKYYDETLIMAQVKSSIDNKKDYERQWRNKYDYSLSLKMCKDGIYRGWLSQEFKNCGNGHYYLLIGYNHAIFCEDD